MNDSPPIDLGEQGHLVVPPIIDFLYFEPDMHAYVAEFVPDQHISSERTEAVYIPQESDDGRRICEFMQTIARLLSSDVPVARIFHKGGGNFGFYLNDNTSRDLLDAPNSLVPQQIYEVLQAIANYVQFAFLGEKQKKQPAASK